MARKALVIGNNKKKDLVERYAERRAALTAVVRDPSLSLDKKMEAQRSLAKLPRNSSKTRVRNRCKLCGRPRGYLGFFNLSRLCFRNYASFGMLPGVKKASW